MDSGGKGEKTVVEPVASSKESVATIPGMVVLLRGKKAPQEGAILWPPAAQIGDGKAVSQHAAFIFISFMKSGYRQEQNLCAIKY